MFSVYHVNKKKENTARETILKIISTEEDKMKQILANQLQFTSF